MKVVILGGLTGNATITEAEAGKQYLINKNVSTERIITEHQSRHTLENLKFAKKMINELGIKQTALLTNRFHLYRALALAKGFKLKVVPCAAENIFSYKISYIIRILTEAFFNHWHVVGKIYAFATKNKHMISRIS